MFFLGGSAKVFKCLLCIIMILCSFRRTGTHLCQQNCISRSTGKIYQTITLFTLLVRLSETF